MKYTYGAILVLILSTLIGIWVDYSLPHYGFPLGFGIGLSFVIGVFTKLK